MYSVRVHSIYGVCEKAMRIKWQLKKCICCSLGVINVTIFFFAIILNSTVNY